MVIWGVRAMRGGEQQEIFSKAHCFYKIIRSVRINIAEQILCEDIDLDHLETRLISKKMRKKKNKEGSLVKGSAKG